MRYSQLEQTFLATGPTATVALYSEVVPGYTASTWQWGGKLAVAEASPSLGNAMMQSPRSLYNLHKRHRPIIGTLKRCSTVCVHRVMGELSAILHSAWFSAAWFRRLGSELVASCTLRCVPGPWLLPFIPWLLIHNLISAHQAVHTSRRTVQSTQVQGAKKSSRRNEMAATRMPQHGLQHGFHSCLVKKLCSACVSSAPPTRQTAGTHSP